MNFIKDFNNFHPISENLKYHLDNNISILENIFRPYSNSFYELISEARNHFDSGQKNFSDLDNHLFSTTDFGKFEYYEGNLIPLDLPILNEDIINEAEYKGKKVNLNKPMRSSGPKKYKVYVKNPKNGKIKVVHFGDVKGGLTSKINDPVARKSFVARHKCRRKWKASDKLSAKYWSCHLPRYKNIIKTKFSGYW